MGTARTFATFAIVLVLCALVAGPALATVNRTNTGPVDRVHLSGDDVIIRIQGVWYKYSGSLGTRVLTLVKGNAAGPFTATGSSPSENEGDTAQNPVNGTTFEGPIT